jgi:hypothetical protein
VEIEVVPAGVAVEQLRRNGHARREKNHGDSGEAAPARSISSFHGSIHTVNQGMRGAIQKVCAVILLFTINIPAG